jgi:hypothetical protein
MPQSLSAVFIDLVFSKEENFKSVLRAFKLMHHELPLLV